MHCLTKLQYVFLAVLAAAMTVSASQFTVVSYEPSETGLVVSSGEIATIHKVQGGINGVPSATNGSYVLKLQWTGQLDRKVELSQKGFNYNFAGFDQMLIDVYIPEGSALFQSNGLIGIWSSNWLPGNWCCGNTVPSETGKWFTVRMNIGSLNEGTLNYISALVFENYGADEGMLYVDNIRLVSCEPNGLTATGADSRIDLCWQPIPGVDGYNIYRADSQNGTFVKINSDVHRVSVYSDFLGVNNSTKYYYVVSVVGGAESARSAIVSAGSYAMTDEQFLDSIQEATFKFFWDYAHPVSGLIRDNYEPAGVTNTCALGGTGMGLMAICVGSERGFVTRTDAAQRVLKTLNFLNDVTPRYHGAWAHFADGDTGQTLAVINSYDNGADLVETAYIAEGLLTVRQYFNSGDTTETQIRNLATQMWEGIDWYWYLRRTDPNYTNNESLYWHWSPDYNWAMDMPIHGFNECQITYLLAIASPTHPIPASCYYNGWTSGGYKNGSTYYGYKQWVGGFESCMFFTHYTQLGFDPRNKYDNFCNYFDNSRNIALIDRAYCIANPKGYTDYNEFVWGMTASYNPWGYGAHAPGSPDNGTISPTAALSSTPYTPTESIAAMKHFYHNYNGKIWGPFGFTDAFNPTVDWFSQAYIAIDQGPILIMIENYRTSLCWNAFMANPEITQMLDKIGWATRADNGLQYEYYEGTWNSLPDFDSLNPVETGIAQNFDVALRQRDDNYALRFKGYIDIKTAGTYTFYTNSDDGSKLYIDNTLVVNNDGLHSAQDASGTISLSAGRHKIVVTYFEKTGSEVLTVSFAGPEISKKQIPVNLLFRCNLSGDYTQDCIVDMNDLKVLAANWLSSFNFIDFSQMAADWHK
jgi:hypothetical protein